MSVLWMDDPSYYAGAQLSTRYAVSVGASGVGTGGRFGGSAWTGFISATYNRTQIIASTVTGVAAVSFLFPSFPAGNVGLLSFWDSATLQCDLRMNSAGQLFVTRNGTQIGSTSTLSMTTNVWYRIEFKITIDP